MIGPRDAVDNLLAELKAQLNLGDVVKLYNPGDEGTMLSMWVKRVEDGFILKGKDSLVTDVLVELGLENAKAALLPETVSQKPELTDHESLSTAEHFQYMMRVGKLLHFAAHRADTQHGLGVLSTALSAPTTGVRRAVGFCSTTAAPS